MTTRICIVGTGYAGVSLALLLAQRNAVTALNIVAGKVRMLSARLLFIRDPKFRITWLISHSTCMSRQTNGGCDSRQSGNPGTGRQYREDLCAGFVWK